MLLIALIGIPLAGAVAIACLPRSDSGVQKGLSLALTTLNFLVSLLLLTGFDKHESGIQFEARYPWVPQIGMEFHVGIDGISLWLVLLTTLLVPIALLASGNAIKSRVKEFCIAVLILEAAMVGTLVALDLFLFYVCYESILIPMYLIVGIWGHGQRVYAAQKLFFFTLAGSLLMLVAIIYVYVSHGQGTGNYTFDLLAIKESLWGRGAELWLFGAFFLAFAIKIPLFPLHSWLPDAHTQAPTAGSVVLAGILLKMGTYGILRFAIPLFPGAFVSCAPYIASISVLGIIYGAMVAFAQKDAKRLIAFSSVSHMGFIVLGMMAMNQEGITGSVYQMLSHGISTGGLFLAIGFLYDRRKTHELDEFGGLAKRMPVFAAILLIVMLSSAGLPGLNGFVGEFLILIGTFLHDKTQLIGSVPSWIWAPKTLTALGALGIVLGAAYLLRLCQKLLFGPITSAKNAELSDLSSREIIVFLPIVALIFLMGIYPKPFTSRMDASIQQLIKDHQSKYIRSRAKATGSEGFIRARHHSHDSAPNGRAEGGRLARPRHLSSSALMLPREPSRIVSRQIFLGSESSETPGKEGRSRE